MGKSITHYHGLRIKEEGIGKNASMFATFFMFGTLVLCVFILVNRIWTILFGN